MPHLTPKETTQVRAWLGRCIDALERLPPTPVRKRSLCLLNDRLRLYQPTSNVVLLRRAG